MKNKPFLQLKSIVKKPNATNPQVGPENKQLGSLVKFLGSEEPLPPVPRFDPPSDVISANFFVSNGTCSKCRSGSGNNTAAAKLKDSSNGPVLNKRMRPSGPQLHLILEQKMGVSSLEYDINT